MVYGELGAGCGEQGTSSDNKLLLNTDTRTLASYTVLASSDTSALASAVMGRLYLMWDNFASNSRLLQVYRELVVSGGTLTCLFDTRNKCVESSTGRIRLQRRFLL